jgi:hypothetical protein
MKPLIRLLNHLCHLKNVANKHKLSMRACAQLEITIALIGSYRLSMSIYANTTGRLQAGFKLVAERLNNLTVSNLSIFLAQLTCVLVLALKVV